MINPYETMPYEPEESFLQREDRFRMKIVALGGGGGKILDRVLATWPAPPPAAAANTDATALQSLDIPEKHLLGEGITHQLGCGGDTRLGQMAADEAPDALSAMVADTDLAIILASLGGGFGTGAAPVVARAARKAGALTLAYVTTPFAVEGSQRMNTARNGLLALRDAADAVVVFPNEHLRTLLPRGATLEASFAETDRMVAAALRGLWSLLARDNPLNYDFSDLQTLVENADNECTFGYGEGSGPDRVEDAINALLEGPGLDHSSILANAGAMLINVIGGRDLSLDELHRIRTRITDVARQGAQISIGAALLDDYAGRVVITVLAAERWTPPAPPPAPPRAAPLPETAARRRKTAPDGQASLFSPDAAPADAPAPDEPSPFPPETDLDTPTYLRRRIHIRS